MHGSGESFGEVRDAREVGALEPGADACLKDEKRWRSPCHALKRGIS